MPTHEQELAIQLGQALVRIDALKFELAEARERLAIITTDRDELLTERDRAAERIAALESALVALTRVADSERTKLEAERDRLRGALDVSLAALDTYDAHLELYSRNHLARQEIRDAMKMARAALGGKP